MPITPGKWVAKSSDYRPDRYYRYVELTDLLHRWAADHPDLVSIESIGQSLERRDIWALTITDRSAGSAESKPAYFVDANIHADEVTGVATVLWLINHLLTSPDDPAVQRLLTNTTFYLVPAINVDGMDLSLSEVPTASSAHPSVPSPTTSRRMASSRRTSTATAPSSRCGSRTPPVPGKPRSSIPAS
jgi:murein tripeptide amidase MpaA